MAGSITEQLKIIDPLTNPTAHGGNASDAFHIVVPSMPGYGFSGKPATTGWDPAHIARAWTVLMKRLGYDKFVAQGGDWGAIITVLSGDDFDADIAERYGWVNRTLDDGNLDSFVDSLVRRLASFDRETLAAAKAQVNRFGTPTAMEFQSSIDLFFPLLALPGAQARRAKIRNIGYGVPSDFELNFGRYLPSFGRADDDDTDKQAG